MLPENARLDGPKIYAVLALVQRLTVISLTLLDGVEYDLWHRPGRWEVLFRGSATLQKFEQQKLTKANMIDATRQCYFIKQLSQLEELGW